MAEVSNKTLATLLIAAIVISLGGTLISLNKLGKVQVGVMAGITGKATDTGTVNVTIIEDLTIEVNDTNHGIDFGSGVVTNPNAYEDLDSREWNASGGGEGNNTGNGNWSEVDDGILIENQGTVDLNITVKSGKLAAGYLCDVGGGCSDATPLYNFTCTDAGAGGAEQPEASSCQSGETLTSTAISNVTAQVCCGQLDVQDASNLVRFDVQLRVPADASGAKTDTVTFLSAKSGTQS